MQEKRHPHYIVKKVFINHLPSIKVNSNSTTSISQCKCLHSTPILVGMNQKSTVCKIQKVFHQSWSTCSDKNGTLTVVMHVCG